MARFNLQTVAVSPPTPAPGFASIYFKNDNVLYIKDSSGLETPIGTASGITSLTGEGTATGPGAAALTLSNSAVIAKVLTGFVAGPNSAVIATDSIFEGIQKLQAQVSATVGSAITALTGDVSATGPGSAVSTVNFVGGSSAANINSAELLANASTALNTAGAIVRRDGSGNIAISGLSSTSLSSIGNADIVQAIIKGFSTQTNDVLQVLKSDNTILFKVDNSGNGTFLGTINSSNFSGSSSGTNTGDVSFAAVGTAPSANGATVAGQVITLQPADGTHPGLLSILAQSIAGIKTFISQLLVSDTTQSTDKDTGSIVTEGGIGAEKNINAGGNIAAVGTLAGSNFSGSSSGTNTGDVTLTAVGAVPNANGASLSGQALTLQPADDTHPGLLTILSQNIAGIKTFFNQLLVSDTTQSTNKDTGSIVTEGGLGVEKNINAGGNISAVGALSGSNFSGSSSGTNTGDVTVTDTDSIDLTLAGQNVSAALKLSSDAADILNLKATTTIHSGIGAGLHVEYPYGSPVNIGTSNNPGSASGFALYDHVHAITSPVVLGLLLTGYVVGANTPLAATDSILGAFQKVQGQINAITGSAITSLTGDITATGPGAAASTIAVGAVTDTKSSLAVKPAVTVVATTDQTKSGTPTIDGQATAAGSLILLTAQATGSENGPWVAAAGAWSRPTWYPSGGTTQAFAFITTFVRLGTVYGGSMWRQTTAAPITIDTTATTWVVTPVSGNYKSIFTIGPASGSSNVDLVFANTFTGTIRWNPTVSHVLTLPATQGVAGTSLQNDGSGNLSWSNLNTNIDGGKANSVYTPSQFINGGTA